MNSKQSTSRTAKNICSMPLELVNGWNHICLNLSELTEAAFGVKYDHATKVTVYSTMRLLRCFFQDRQYADIELPDHLRTGPKGLN
jgi:hypothetical protein